MLAQLTWGEFAGLAGVIIGGFGVLGAVGALGIIFAMKYGGKPIFVAPLVFAGAPVMNTFISMAWDKPTQSPSAWFYAGIVITAAGAAMVLYHKPA